MKEKNQIRGSLSEFTTREDGEQPIIEGYFSVFNTNYDMGFEMSESVAPGAFTKSLSNDVRALINHDTTLVLGRTSAHTLELREDSHGLWGKITINPKDGDAMNLYERVKRGDVNQCSFGFNIVSEETDFRRRQRTLDDYGSGLTRSISLYIPGIRRDSSFSKSARS